VPRDGLTTWMGYRPTLPDHLPVMGRAPDGRNIFFAFGHQHLGLTLAPITAELVESQISSGASPIELAPFNLDRL